MTRAPCCPGTGGWRPTWHVGKGTAEDAAPKWQSVWDKGDSREKSGCTEMLMSWMLQHGRGFTFNTTNKASRSSKVFIWSFSFGNVMYQNLDFVLPNSSLLIYFTITDSFPLKPVYLLVDLTDDSYSLGC